jgi:hypothetical protein
LKGEPSEQTSIRINDQWRICFIWKAGDARQVEIVDLIERRMKRHGQPAEEPSPQ